MELPRAFRPYRALLLAVAPLLQDDAYLGMTEAQFVAAIMKASHGSVQPERAAWEFRWLRAEAGVI